MIRILYFRHPKNPLNAYIEGQIHKSNFQDCDVETYPVDEETIEKFDLTTFQTFIFTDKNENELLRVVNPVCSKELEAAYQFVKGHLSNLIMQGAVK